MAEFMGAVKTLRVSCNSYGLS